MKLSLIVLTINPVRRILFLSLKPLMFLNDHETILNLAFYLFSFISLERNQSVRVEDKTTEKVMAILTEEVGYARSLASFLASKEEFLYKPIAFSDVQAYLRFEQENTVDLLLCDRGLEPEERPDGPRKVCVLSEYSTVSEDDGGHSSIFKYQSSERLMQDILACVGTEEESGAAVRRPRHTDAAERFTSAVPLSEPARSSFRLIGVCSPIGGSRCSTFAFALSEYLAKKGPTIFVSLDAFFSAPVKKDVGVHDLSELLYFLETRPEGEMPELMDYVCESEGAAVIKGPSHWLDLENMGKDALVGLARLIENAGYECAVFDLGRPQTAATELLRRCTEIHVTKGKSRHDETVITEWKRQLRLSGLSEIAERLGERIVPNDRCAEGVLDRDTLLTGSLGGYLKEMLDHGYVG